MNVASSVTFPCQPKCQRQKATNYIKKLNVIRGIGLFKYQYQLNVFPLMSLSYCCTFQLSWFIGHITVCSFVMDGRPLSVKRASMLHFANVFIYLFLWPPYSPAQVNGGSRKFYTWWTLSVVREVTTWIFSWSSLNYRVGQKVTKFGIFSDPARKLSALTPERGRIL